MKTLIVLFSLTLIAGAIWYRSEYIVENSDRNAPIVVEDMIGEVPQEIAVVGSVEAGQAVLAQEEFEPVDLEESRGALLEEYWSSLLQTRQGPEWSPSQRVDDLIELQRLLGLGSKEAFDYLSSLMDLPDVDPSAKEFYATMLLARLGTLHPEEAMAYLVETDHAFSVEDYENVVRLWMDQDGVSVMDWFVKNEIPVLKPELIAPFISVFAEEDPYAFLLQYQLLDSEGLYTDRALGLLYESYGYEIYDSLSNEEMSAEALVKSFEYVGNQLVADDPAFARDWLMNKRFNVDIGATASVARNLITADIASESKTPLEALNWGLSNQLILPYDHVVFDTIELLANRSVDEAIGAITSLREKYGDRVDYLAEMIPPGYTENDTRLYDGGTETLIDEPEIAEATEVSEPIEEID